MKGRLTRVLALACALVAALPPGWCCAIASARPAPVQVPAETPAEIEPCCPCCKVPAPSPQAPVEPLPAPPVCQICDPSPHALPPAVTAVDMQADALFFDALIVPANECLPAAGASDSLISVGRPPTPPIHVSHCVWRC